MGAGQRWSPPTCRYDFWEANLATVDNIQILQASGWAYLDTDLRWHLRLPFTAHQFSTHSTTMSFISSTLVHAASFLAFGVATFNPTNFIGGVDFKPDRDITSLAGKVILITGGELQSSKIVPDLVCYITNADGKSQAILASARRRSCSWPSTIPPRSSSQRGLRKRLRTPLNLSSRKSRMMWTSPGCPWT